MKTESKIPTNRGIEGKTIYASEELVNSLASYEHANIAFSNGFNEETEWYWYDNTAWNKNEPIGLINKEDAFDRSSKGIAFIDFDTTIPAPTKEQFPNPVY